MNPSHGQGRSLRSRPHRFPRAVAAAGAGFFLGFGAWAMAGPRSFFNTVATFHPYNQHFVQDLGAFQIGLGAVLLLAVVTATAEPLSVALVGAGAGSGAHVVSHLVGRDLGGTPETDIPVFAVVTLVLLAAGVVSWGGARAEMG